MVNEEDDLFETVDEVVFTQKHKYTIGSKKLKMTINQDLAEVHQRDHQRETPRNSQVLENPSHQEALLEKPQ